MSPGLGPADEGWARTVGDGPCSSASGPVAGAHECVCTSPKFKLFGALAQPRGKFTPPTKGSLWAGDEWQDDVVRVRRTQPARGGARRADGEPQDSRVVAIPATTNYGVLAHRRPRAQVLQHIDDAMQACFIEPDVRRENSHAPVSIVRISSPSGWGARTPRHCPGFGMSFGSRSTRAKQDWGSRLEGRRLRAGEARSTSSA